MPSTSFSVLEVLHDSNADNNQLLHTLSTVKRDLACSDPSPFDSSKGSNSSKLKDGLDIVLSSSVNVV
ncbi:hypothetical protein X975_01803, partial [Stegodyphus mimosarum]